MVVDPVPPQIPIKLQRAGYRFIQILPGSKDPREKKYTTEKNYLADEPGIALWIGHYQSFEWSSRNEADNGLYTHYEGYGNYGILCSDTLAAFDLDTPELIDFTLAEFPELKDALLLQSGSGKGMHIPFKTDCAKTTPFVDPDTKENIGHVKAKGGYIVGPGCLHPDGGIYRILNDGEIPFIPFDQILEHFSNYITKKPREERVVDNQSTFYHTSATLSIDIPIERIWSPVKPIRNGSEIQGAHPTHGSKGGSNFSINTRKNVWRCWRCNSGGGPAEAIAVKHGLIDCDDAHPGCLRGDLFRQVLEIAEEEYGWTRPIKTTPVRPTILPEISNATFDIEIFEQTGVHTDILPEDLPENFEALLLDGLPRIGKTHWSEMQAIKHKTANIIANTHSVIDQHLRIFRENRNPGQTAVHLEGRNRCCRMQEGERRSCSRCPLYPYTEDPADRGRFISFVGESLHKSEIITKNDVPDGYCPYFFCKESAKMADYVFTVPDNLEEITGENHQSRHLTIIDEDTCFPSFFPQSVDLAEFVRGPTRNYVVNLVEMKWIGIQKWKDYIVEKKKRPKGKATILKMIEILENIREILRIKDDVVFTPSEILHDVSLVDLNIPEPTDITKPELLRAIERWEIPDTFSLFAKALLYPYKEKTLDWQGYNPMKLRLIANEEERIYEPPNTKMILIGSTRAEMFLKTLDVKYDAIRINKFQYSKNFVFFVVKGKSGRGNARKWNFRNAVKTALKRVAKTNSDTRYPLLVLVGTKKEQSNIMEDLGGICKGSSDENIQGQRWNYIGGFFNIFYQNSVISRGVDIPFYKTLIVYSSDFANPYWLAKMKVAIENKDRDGAEYAESVMDAITVDETTNSSLRVTPVVGHTDTVPRVVVISEKDLWKIKPVVLSEAQVVEVEAEQLFDNFEKILNCSGRLEILPEREDVDEFNRNVIHWGVDTVFDEPEAIRNLPVEAKGEFYAKTIVRSEGDEDAWRHRYRPDVIKEVEDSVVRYLVHLDKTGKTTRFNSLKEYISKRNKKFKPTLVNDVIMGLYKMGSIRIDNIAKDTTAAIVRISSVYVDKELEEKGRS